MSSYPKVIKEDMIKLAKLSEKQKNQRADKIKNRILKQTHDEELAEAFTPKTKKLAEVNQSTKKLEVFF